LCRVRRAVEEALKNTPKLTNPDPSWGNFARALRGAGACGFAHSARHTCSRAQTYTSFEKDRQGSARMNLKASGERDNDDRPDGKPGWRCDSWDMGSYDKAHARHVADATALISPL